MEAIKVAKKEGADVEDYNEVVKKIQASMKS